MVHLPSARLPLEVHCPATIRRQLDRLARCERLLLIVQLDLQIPLGLGGVVYRNRQWRLRCRTANLLRPKLRTRSAAKLYAAGPAKSRTVTSTELHATGPAKPRTMTAAKLHAIRSAKPRTMTTTKLHTAASANPQPVTAADHNAIRTADLKTATAPILVIFISARAGRVGGLRAAGDGTQHKRRSNRHDSYHANESDSKHCLASLFD